MNETDEGVKGRNRALWWKTEEEGPLGASAVLCPCSSVQSVSLPGRGPQKTVLTSAPVTVLVWNWALTGQSPLGDPLRDAGASALLSGTAVLRVQFTALTGFLHHPRLFCEFVSRRFVLVVCNYSLLQTLHCSISRLRMKAAWTWRGCVSDVSSSCKSLIFAGNPQARGEAPLLLQPKILKYTPQAFNTCGGTQ